MLITSRRQLLPPRGDQHQSATKGGIKVENSTFHFYGISEYVPSLTKTVLQVVSSSSIGGAATVTNPHTMVLTNTTLSVPVGKYPLLFINTVSVNDHCTFIFFFFSSNNDFWSKDWTD